ncbi:copper-binding protein [uncultured Roseobacter sp.]|uniref:copper-binding protein n=1 Tax=uncultured Roseobacter sp. TaxID=114847 RepID=UPI002618A837|nr:copper-binding protein [uncultured Roseobacter sp.]
MTTRRLKRRSVIAGTVATAAVPGLLLAETGKVHDIAVRSFAFLPELVQVRFGDVIRWTNNDIAPHTATADDSGWDTGTLAKDAAAEVQVTAGMETTYFCAFHPHMKGRIEIID